MPDPRLSIIIPVRNGARTLRSTLAAIQGQTRAPFEILVVDNGSTDGSGRIASAFPGVRVLRCEEPGRSRARNFGARRAKGSHLAFVDADVSLSPGWLETVERAIRMIPVDALATRIEPVGTAGAAVDRYRRIFAAWKSGGTGLSVRSCDGALPQINTAACVIARDAFERLGGFDEALVRHEDLDLALRLFFTGHLLGGVSRARARVRFEEGSGALARERAYLARSFEVQASLFLKSDGAVRGSLLREVWERTRCPKTLAFACLNEAAWNLGGLQRRLRQAEPRSWKSAPGRNFLVCHFRTGSRRHFLQPGLNFIFADGDVFLMGGPFRSRCLPGRAGSAVRALYAGRELTRAEKEALLGTGAFRTMLTGGRPQLRQG